MRPRREHGRRGRVGCAARNARRSQARPGHWWADQLNNRDAITGYHALGEEIWEQTNGTVDAFVHMVELSAIEYPVDPEAVPASVDQSTQVFGSLVPVLEVPVQA